jgi:hypothetical protein
MHSLLETTTATARLLWHFPVVVVLVIYLPAAILGASVFGDVYAASVLALLAIFSAVYYGLYPRFSRLLQSTRLRTLLWRTGDRIDWRSLAWLAVAAYGGTIAIAALTVTATPLAIALKGGSLYQIADARADFLVNRHGFESLLRYSSVILGRTVLPFIVTYAYWSGHRARHAALAALLLCYLIPLEKASPLFAFLPLILLRSLQANWKAALAHAASLLACIALWTFLAMGSLDVKESQAETRVATQMGEEKRLTAPRDAPEVKRQGDSKRHYVFYYIDDLDLHQVGTDPALDHLLWLVNRTFWSPYVTAYDWLRFHDDVLGGRLTLGRQIGVVGWVTGKPIKLEQMVYQYQYGASPSGGGASNTIFLVDAKLAFGWLGVVAYCVLLTFFSAVVFSSSNTVAQIASVTSFFTASLSPLTATLLSGGLFFYLMISLLARPAPTVSPAVVNRPET